MMDDHWHWSEEEGQAETSSATGPGVLPPTPYSREIGAGWLELLEPWVGRFREEAFGDAAAPFPGWSAAAKWIETALHRLDAGGKAEEADAEQRALKWPENPRGVPFLLPGGLVFLCVRVDWKARRAFFRRPARPFLAYDPDATQPRTHVIEGFTDRSAWSWPPVLDPRIPPLVTLSNLTREWAQLTGVGQAGLVQWVLAAVPPTFPRARSWSRQVRKPVPDGTDMVSRRVVVEFFTPDITWDELQGLHRRIREEWQRLGVPVPSAGAARRPTFTENDRRLLDALGGGGIPERLSRDWLRRLAEEWIRRGGRPRSLDAHRKHCERLTRKERKGVLPSRARSAPGAPGTKGTVSLP
jgi:hypothetical protein